MQNNYFENENNSYNKTHSNIIKKFIWIPILVIIILLTIVSMTTISEGHIGVKYRFGKIVDTGIQAGLHFHLPFIERISKVDITQQEYLVDLTAYTKDTQTVEHMIVKVNYSYDASQIDTVIRTIGIKNVESKLVAPQVLSNTKNIVGKYKAEELISNRAECQELIEETLSESLIKNGIIVAAVNIEEITFKTDFEAIVEKKVAAEQEALTVQNETVKKQEEAKQKVIEAEAEAEAIKVKAEAEAEANRVVSESLTDKLIEYKKIEAWNGEFPEVMGNTVNPFVTIE